MTLSESPLARAGALGFAGGLRTFTPLAALHLRGDAFPGCPGRFLLASALAELVVDKLPQTPSRLVPLALGARLISGSVSGHAAAGKSGIAPGGAAALAGAFAGHRARRALAGVTGWPDWRCAVVEDALAATLAGLAATKAGPCSGKVTLHVTRPMR